MNTRASLAYAVELLLLAVKMLLVCLLLAAALTLVVC